MVKIDSSSISKYVADLEDKNTIASLIISEYSDMLAIAIQVLISSGDGVSAQKFVSAYVKKMEKYSDYITRNTVEKNLFDESLENLKRFASSKTTPLKRGDDEKNPT